MDPCTFTVFPQPETTVSSTSHGAADRTLHVPTASPEAQGLSWTVVKHLHSISHKSDFFSATNRKLHWTIGALSLPHLAYSYTPSITQLRIFSKAGQSLCQPPSPHHDWVWARGSFPWYSLCSFLLSTCLSHLLLSDGRSTLGKDTSPVSET